jgi:hypothetical protein
MGWKSFWQSLVTNIVSAMLILGVGALLTILEATNSKWARPTLYGLAGIALMALVIFAFTGRAILSKKQPQTTVENVEANVRVWLDYFGLAVQRADDPQAHFILHVRCGSGIGVTIARPRARDRYLLLLCKVEISKEHQDILAALPKERSARIGEEVNLELARTGVGYNLTFGADGTMTVIQMSKAVPITGSLTEDTFIASVDKVESSVHIAREVVRLAIDSAKPPIRHGA